MYVDGARSVAFRVLIFLGNKFFIYLKCFMCNIIVRERDLICRSGSDLTLLGT